MLSQQLGMRPVNKKISEMTRQEKQVSAQWAMGGLAKSAAVILCLVGSGIGALLIMKATKAEYKEMALQNLKDLVETRKASVQAESVDSAQSVLPASAPKE
jgi:hypothetical protein